MMKLIPALSILALAMLAVALPAWSAHDITSTQATIRYVPLPQRVQDSQLIVTGKVVKAELQTLQPGVDEVYCFIQIGSVLKGKPRTVSTPVLGKSIQTVVISFFTGPNVPGNYGYHAVADNAVRLLSPVQPSLYPAKNQKFLGSLYGGDMEPSSQLGEVKRLLSASFLPAPPHVP